MHFHFFLNLGACFTMSENLPMTNLFLSINFYELNLMSFVWSNYATCNLCMDITNKRLSRFLGKLK